VGHPPKDGAPIGLRWVKGGPPAEQHYILGLVASSKYPYPRDMGNKDTRPAAGKLFCAYLTYNLHRA